jgi:5'-AMP-activated protein kinase catalytic alpha subunit
MYMSMSTSNVCVYFLKVMASRTKIYIVMELVTGGELFDKIVSD